MIYEIAWTRVLSLLIGSSVYAFSLMLTAFVSGLAIGSLVFSRFADRVRDPMRTLGWMQIVIGLAALIVVPLLGELPFFVTGMIAKFGNSFGLLQLAEFGLIFLIMLVPTVLMGASFPLASRLVHRHFGQVGRSVGTVYGSNTLGTIIGSFVGGFLLIPWLGIQHTLLTAVLINMTVGVALLLQSQSTSAAVRTIAVGAVAAAAWIAMMVLPSWNPAAMSFGPFVQAVWLSTEDAHDVDLLKQLVSDQETIFHHEGVSTTVTVKRDAKGIITLLTNGRIEASSSGGELQQKLLAHLPLLIHPDPESVLQIGLASGVTLNSAACHPLKRLDCVELSPGVVDATRFFEDVNGKVLLDDRLRMFVTDGRNHLSLSDETYDVIISQPSDPAVAGVGDLFTSEFFALCRSRLTLAGVTCVWLKASTVEPDAFRSVVGAFCEVFEDVSVWTATGHTEFLLIGSKQPFSLDLATISARMNQAAVAKDLHAIQIKTVPDLLANFVTTRSGAEQFAGTVTRHTDDNALLEFSAPRSTFERRDPDELIEAFQQVQDLTFPFLTNSATGSDAKLAIEQVKAQTLCNIQAKKHVYRANQHLARGEIDEAIEALRAGAALNPRDSLLNHICSKLSKTATNFVAEGKIPQAIRVCEKLVLIYPNRVDLRFNLASLLRDHGQIEGAIRQYAEAAHLAPDNYLAHHNLAKLAAKQGGFDLAIRHYRRVLDLKPDVVQALNNLAWIYATCPQVELRNPIEAVRLAELACNHSKQQDADHLDTLSVAYEAAEQIGDAQRVAQQALTIAQATDRSDLVASLTRRLNLYQKLLQPSE